MSSTRSSLCPGYKQVDAFGPDEDYEDEEEVSYVTLDLGSIEPTLVPSSSTYRLIGLDTPTPFLQLSGTILKGRHDSLLGTELLFTDDRGTDPNDRNKKSVVHVANTERRICFREVRLQPKERSESERDADEDESSMVVDDAARDVDRLAGMKPPRTARAPRKRAAAAGEGGKRKARSEGKGKERAVEEHGLEQEDGQAGPSSVGGDDAMDAT